MYRIYLRDHCSIGASCVKSNLKIERIAVFKRPDLQTPKENGRNITLLQSEEFYFKNCSLEKYRQRSVTKFKKNWQIVLPDLKVVD